MLEKIKSKYILEFLSSLVEEKTIIKLIKYNKYMQKRLNIDILTYKRLSGKYRISQRNGRGKEYDAYT